MSGAKTLDNVSSRYLSYHIGQNSIIILCITNSIPFELVMRFWYNYFDLLILMMAKV